MNAVPQRVVPNESELASIAAVVTELPCRVEVARYLGPRYLAPGRPLSWDDRREGTEYVELTTGQIIKLQSDGGQSAPIPGWVLMITSGDSSSGYRWTLYGMPRH